MRVRPPPSAPDFSFQFTAAMGRHAISRGWRPTRMMCYASIMKRDEAIDRLKTDEAELRSLGVEGLFMFGSTARGEARETSDVDMFFDHEEGTLGLFALMDIKDRTASILGCSADLMTRRSLHPFLRKEIEESAVRVF